MGHFFYGKKKEMSPMVIRKSAVTKSLVICLLALTLLPLGSSLLVAEEQSESQITFYVQ